MTETAPVAARDPVDLLAEARVTQIYKHSAIRSQKWATCGELIQSMERRWAGQFYAEVTTLGYELRPIGSPDLAARVAELEAALASKEHAHAVGLAARIAVLETALCEIAEGVEVRMENGTTEMCDHPHPEAIARAALDRKQAQP